MMMNVPPGTEKLPAVKEASSFYIPVSIKQQKINRKYTSLSSYNNSNSVEKHISEKNLFAE